jgi:hypothetical protein
MSGQGFWRNGREVQAPDEWGNRPTLGTAPHPAFGMVSMADARAMADKATAQALRDARGKLAQMAYAKWAAGREQDSELLMRAAERI